MKPLSINKALKLYKLIAPYYPEIDDDDTMLEFIGKIIQKIQDSGNHRDYLEIVALMMGVSVTEIVNNLNTQEILEMFAEGIQDNKLLLLQAFCEKVGFNG